MSELTTALSSIASSPATKGVMDIASLGSTGYNLYNQYQNQQYQNKLRDYSTDPAKVTALAEQYTKPLDAGLTAAVNNQTQAQLAQAGLSESPQIAQQVEAQAIAPYIQQNQQAGYQDALQALNLGGGAVNPNTQSSNTIAALAKAFSQLPGAGGGSAALKQLLQMAGSAQQPQTTSPDLSGVSIPDQPTQGVDLSGFYQPDYAAAAGGGAAAASEPYAGSD